MHLFKVTPFLSNLLRMSCPKVVSYYKNLSQATYTILRLWAWKGLLNTYMLTTQKCFAHLSFVKERCTLAYYFENCT